MTVYHETWRFDCSPERLFLAYTDPRQREAWSAPGPGTVVEILSGDVSAGGVERARCGPEGDLRWSLDTTYPHVEPDRTITFTELLREGDTLLTIALVTLATAPDGTGSRLDLTDQVTSLVGEEGASGHRSGYESALLNLDGLLVSA